MKTNLKTEIINDKEVKENIEAIIKQTAEIIYNHCKFNGSFTKQQNIFIPAFPAYYMLKLPHNPTQFYYYFRVKILYFYITIRARIGRRELNDNGELLCNIRLKKWTKPVGDIPVFEIER